MKLFRTVLALSLLPALSTCTAGQEKSPDAKQAKIDPYFTPTTGKTTPSMPRVIIRNIREDRAGNIWFATFAGPIRYDGKDFTNFAEEVGLAKTRIFSLLVDRSGALWFGSITGGASRYDGNSFTKFTVKEGLGSNDVLWIFQDQDANIWFGTGNGASRYDGKSMTNFTTKEGLVHNSVYAITQEGSGRIWFGTQGGVCSYDGKSFANLADQVGRSFTNIRALAVDRAGNLWFGGQGGAFRYDGKTLARFTISEGLLDDFVGSMIVDRAGNLWLGHPAEWGGGASRYDGKSFQHFTHKEGLGSKTVYCMLEDKSGNIWFGSVDAGACRYDGKTFTHFSATVPASLPANDHHATIAKGETVSEMSKSIWIIFQDKKNNFWFGSDGQGVYRYDGKTITQFTKKDGLCNNSIREIKEDKAGNVFFTTLDGVSKYDGKAFTTLTVVESGAPDKGWKLGPDDMWFKSFYGVRGHNGPYRYDGKSLYKLKFPKHYMEDEFDAKNPKSVASPYDVYFIYKDTRGHIWFGTACLGLCRYDGKEVSWIYEDHLTNPPGGGSFGIRSIIEDKEGKFWICNTRYRYTVSPENTTEQGKVLVKYKREKGTDPLKTPKGAEWVYYGAITEDGKRDLWMSTYGGGAWRYDGKEMTQYPVKDGDKNALLVSVYKDNQGGLWLGTQESGVYKFNGKTFEKWRP